jgi:hypothetical protein
VEHPAAPPYRFDVVFPVRCIDELLAELTDKDIDDLQFWLVDTAAEIVQEHWLGDRTPFTQAQEFKYLVFLASQMHVDASNGDNLGVEIDAKISNVDDRLGVPVGAAHNSADTSQKLVLVGWLGQVIVSAEAESFYLVLDTGKPGQN